VIPAEGRGGGLVVVAWETWLVGQAL
jgi:hypothetical protein